MSRFILVLVGGVAAAAFAQAGDPELDRVLASLKRRQDQAGVIRIRAEGETVAPKGSDTERFGPFVRREDGKVSPPEDLKVARKQDFLIDYPNRRFRLLHSEAYPAKFQSWVMAYDGTKSYGSKLDIPLPMDLAAGVRPKEVSVHSGGKEIDFFNIEYWPHFLFHGFLLTKNGQKYLWSDLRVPLDPEEAYVHGRETFRGQACTVLRTFPVGRKKGGEAGMEYSIADGSGAVRRVALLLGERKTEELTLDYRTEGGREVLGKWRHDFFVAKSTKPVAWETFTVTRIEFAPGVSDETFILRPEAGTIVTEKVHGDTWEQFHGKEAKTRVHQADESGTLIEGELVDGQFRPRRRYLWWIGAAFGLLALLAIVLRLRRRGPSPSDSVPPAPQGG